MLGWALLNVRLPRLRECALQCRFASGSKPARPCSLHAGDRVVAHADGAGRVILERNLCARHRTLKQRDALVIATAVASGAAEIIPTDRKWPTAKAMELTVSIERI